MHFTLSAAALAASTLFAVVSAHPGRKIHPPASLHARAACGPGLEACGPDCYDPKLGIYACTDGKLGPASGGGGMGTATRGAPGSASTKVAIPPVAGTPAAIPPIAGQKAPLPTGQKAPVPTGQKAPVPNSTKAPTAPPPKGTMAPGSGSGSTPATDPGQTGPPVPKPSSGRLIEIVNRCPYTVWPGLAVGAGGELPEKGGFELTSGSTKKLEIKSDTWVSGRIWPRTGCRKDGDKFICATGDCGNKFQCDGQSGKTPATLAEFTLQKGQPDFYDVSNVDGHSIGISIETYGDKVPNPDLAPQYNCGSTACTLDMKGCPPELQLDNGSGGVACANIGTAIRNDTIRAKYPKFQQIFADKDALAAVECACDCPDGSSCGCGDATCKYGCTPHGAKPDAKGVCRVEKWPKSESPGAGTQFPAQYNEVFKKQCPDSYSWQFDDLSSTFQCNNGAYRVVFCPQGH